MRTMMDPTVDAVRESAHPLTASPESYNGLLELARHARFVLLGEASHGTHEFYHERAEITKRLIQEQHFTAVAVEADWPDAYRVNRYVRGLSDDAGAVSALERAIGVIYRPDTERASHYFWARRTNA